MQLEPLTSIEYTTINSRVHNLADGHARLRLGPHCRSATTIETAMSSPHAQLEAQFLEAFYRVANSTPPSRYLLCQSASLAIDAVFKLLSERRRTKVDLIMPTFDNLPMLGRRAGMTLRPIEEGAAPAPDAHAIFLVTPNNPTGWVSSTAYLQSVIEFSASRRLPLIIDRTFRFYEEQPCSLDTLLSESDIDWITIDDTGKTWSTLESKVATVQCGNDSTLNEIINISQEINIGASPLALSLACAAIKDDHGAERARSIVARNHSVLEDLISSHPGLGHLVGAPTSVALLALNRSSLPGSLKLSATLRENAYGVSVLPGAQFYWSDPARGSGLLRLALLREPEEFAAAAAVLLDALSDISMRIPARAR